MRLQQRTQKHFRARFEVRSVLLFSVLLLGAALAAYAQGSAPLSSGASKSSVHPTASGSLDSIPHNRTSTKDLDAAFKRADTNGDGHLSRQEAEHFPALVPHFDQIDGNHDHRLSPDEFRKAAGS
jgi:EF hand